MADSEANHRVVVLGVDASKHSERAFNWYIENLCEKEKDHVFIIHAQEYPAIPTGAFPATYGPTFDSWQREVQNCDKKVKELLEAYGMKCKQHGLKFKLYKEEHHCPGEVICKLAKDEKAQVVVIGCRGMGSLRRTFLGSVSSYCVHHAHIPVAVVPPRKHQKCHDHS